MAQDSYHPTMRLRQVRRYAPITDDVSQEYTVLQQAFAPDYGGQIEWRDVPTVDEDQD